MGENMKATTFRRALASIIDDSGQFITYDFRDPAFRHMDNDELVIAGEDSDEVFAIKIVKVFDEDKKPSRKRGAKK